jgi:hypothetical protein
MRNSPLNRWASGQACIARSTHRMSRSPEYRIWVDMRRRCEKPSVKGFAHYGARGIKVCERWQTFVFFFEDMGPRPSNRHSVERIDNNGNYEPGNCRWATQTEQGNNRRTNRLVTYRGRTITLADAIRAAGSVVRKDTARLRLLRGWSAEAAVETPPDTSVYRSRAQNAAVAA